MRIVLQKQNVVHSGCSVARSSRLLWEQEVAGSNPATPTIFMEISAVIVQKKGIKKPPVNQVVKGVCESG